MRRAVVHDPEHPTRCVVRSLAHDLLDQALEGRMHIQGRQVGPGPGLGLELRIARKDPAAVLPGADRVFVQPTPDGAVANARHQAAALRVSCHIGHAESRQRQAQGGGQLARKRLDLNGELWGERPEGVPGGLSLRGPPIAPRRSACAIG